MDGAKDRILSAARREFARNGYRGASTNRTVKAAGVSKGLLFAHFGSKRELYFTALLDELARFLRAVTTAELPAAGPLERFERMVGASFAYYNSHRTGYALMLSATELERPLRDELVRRLGSIGLPDPLERVVAGATLDQVRFGGDELRRVLSLVLNAVKQTIAAHVRIGTPARELERIFRAELDLALRALREGIYEGGAP